MSDRREIIAQGVEGCKLWTGRYLIGFDDANCTRQPTNLPNHVAWSLGHCAHTMHRVAGMFDGHGIPEGDFAAGAPDEGGPSHRRPTRFWIETIAFNSTPTDDAKVYPGMARSAEVYNAACDRLAGAIRAAADEKLDETVQWGIGPITLGVLCLRMIFHNGDHTGQILDTRRALNMPRVIQMAR